MRRSTFVLFLLVALLADAEVGVAGDDAPDVEARLAALDARLAALESADGGPTTQPATTQAQLRAAAAKIKTLEQKVSKLEAAAAKPVKDKAVAADAGAASPGKMTAGTSGRGDLFNQNAQNPMEASVDVVEADANSAVLRVTCTGSGQTFRVTCQTNGERILVSGVEQTKPPANAPRFNVNKVESGDGTFHDGVLNLAWSVRGSSPPALSLNREWHVSVRNVRLK